MSLLEVKNLKKVYTTRFSSQQVTALSNVSFSVEEGEYVAIMGESGSGKTTLLNILASLDTPTSGEVLLNGEDITKIFKTLVLLNEKKEMIVACIPGADTIDLKKLAKIAGAKKVEMLELKELFNMTGYIRGGCSPIGIKKRHQSFIHQSALTKDYIMISAGVRGLQIIIEPQNLINYLKKHIKKHHLHIERKRKKQ